jgi:hypothetical protein
VAEEDKPLDESAILRDHEVARIWIDENGQLQFHVDVPEGKAFHVECSIIGLAHLSAQVMKFLGDVLATSTRAVLDKMHEGSN